MKNTGNIHPIARRGLPFKTLAALAMSGDVWAGAKAASDMAPADIIIRKFLQLAFDAGITKLGRHGEQDIKHIIDWAIKGHDPFGN